MLKKALWIIISIIAAFSLSVVVGIINPSEKVNALWLVVAAGCFYVITYRFYASFLAAKVLVIDEKRLPLQRGFMTELITILQTAGSYSAITLPL